MKNFFIFFLTKCSIHLVRIFYLPDLVVLKESYKQSLISYEHKR